MNDLGKSRVSGLILSTAILVFFSLANLPYQYVEVNSRWTGAMETEEGRVWRQHYQLPSMAGWPLRFWIRYERAGQFDDRFWSPWSLLGNVTIAIAAAVGAYAFLQWRRRSIRSVHWGRRCRVLFDLTTALVIVGIPSLIVGYHAQVAMHHERLAKSMQRHANCHISSWIPKPFVEHVPKGLRPAFARIRSVQAYRLSDEQAHRIARLPTLVGLSILHSDLPADVLRRLQPRLHFTHLELNEQQFTEDELTAIAQLENIMELGLRSTNVDARMLQQLSDLPLVAADFRDTALKLSEFSRPGWAQTIRMLRMPRPTNGESDALKLDHWPNLKHLSVTGMRPQANAAVLDIQLNDLPQLQSLRLSRLQKHRLKLHNVPRLTHLDEGLGELRYSLSHDRLLPGLTWVTELEIRNAPSIQDLTCFARDLNSFSLRHVPNLRSVAIGSYLTTIHGDRHAQPADKQLCQQWINQLGSLQGPGSVDLSQLPLDSLDLSALGENHHIRSLNLDECGIEFEQIKPLNRMEQLEALNIRSCKLRGEQLNWIVEEFPNMRELVVDGSQLTRLDLHKGLRLRRLQLSELSEIEELRLVDLPLLATRLRLSRTPKHLEIRNAKSLQGLAIDAPWPENAVVEGLRDLEWFAAAGEAVDDDLLKVLLRNRKLHQLTLAYPSLSREALMSIGELATLTTLMVPGADVDDEVTARWHKLESLWEINLDDTRISSSTLKWLQQLDSLRRVSLGRVKLDQPSLKALRDLRQVCEFRFTDANVPLSDLKPLLQSGNLESLDLSGTPYGDELPELLGDPNTLRHLVLRKDDVSPGTLIELLERNPSLYIELDELPKAISDVAAAELQQRARTVRQRFAIGWQGAFRTLGTTSLRSPERVHRREPTSQREVISLAMPDVAGRLKTGQFRPAAFRFSADLP